MANHLLDKQIFISKKCPDSVLLPNYEQNVNICDDVSLRIKFTFMLAGIYFLSFSHVPQNIHHGAHSLQHNLFASNIR